MVKDGDPMEIPAHPVCVTEDLTCVWPDHAMLHVKQLSKYSSQMSAALSVQVWGIHYHSLTLCHTFRLDKSCVALYHVQVMKVIQMVHLPPLSL